MTSYGGRDRWIGNATSDVSYSDPKPLLHRRATSGESQEAVKANASFPVMGYNDFDEPSKMEKLLGNGKVGDILLWRDEKKTFFCFLLLVLLYHSFFIAQKTFISSIAKLLLMFAILLCGHCFLPSSICGFTIDRLPSSSFEISVGDVRNSLLTITYIWNGLSHVTKTLSEGENWITLLKVLSFLCFCKLIVLNSLSLVIGTAIVLSFTLCFVYDQYEVEIDGIATVIKSRAGNSLLLLVKNLPKSVSSVFMPLVEKGFK